MPTLNRRERRSEARRTKTAFVPLVTAANVPAGTPRGPWNDTIIPKDPALKGEKGKNCNRTDCQKAGAVYFNRGTNKYYCSACALRINEIPASDGQPLCSLDEAAVRIYRQNL